MKIVSPNQCSEIYIAVIKKKINPLRRTYALNAMHYSILMNFLKFLSPSMTV